MPEKDSFEPNVFLLKQLVVHLSEANTIYEQLKESGFIVCAPYKVQMLDNCDALLNAFAKYIGADLTTREYTYHGKDCRHTGLDVGSVEVFVYAETPIVEAESEE